MKKYFIQLFRFGTWVDLKECKSIRESFSEFEKMEEGGRHRIIRREIVETVLTEENIPEQSL